MTKKDKTQLTITGILVIVFVVVLTNSIKTVKDRTKAPSSGGTTTQTVKKGSGKKQILRKRSLYKRVEKKAKNLKVTRNPFTKAELSAKGSNTSSEPLLLGIIWDKENPKAIINNGMVGVGDKINGKTLVEIKKDYVILSDGNKRYKLKVGKQKMQPTP